MIKHSLSLSCDMNTVMRINDIINSCSVTTQLITNSFKDICINKPPLPTKVLNDVNTSNSYINTTDIDDIEWSSLYSLKYIAKSFTIPCTNIPPSVFSVIWITHRCKETFAHPASGFHLLSYTNTATPLEVIAQNISATCSWITWSNYSLRFLEQSVTISSLISVRKFPYQDTYLKRHTVHPIGSGD